MGDGVGGRVGEGVVPGVDERHSRAACLAFPWAESSLAWEAPLVAAGFGQPPRSASDGVAATSKATVNRP